MFSSVNLAVDVRLPGGILPQVYSCYLRQHHGCSQRLGKFLNFDYFQFAGLLLKTALFETIFTNTTLLLKWRSIGRKLFDGFKLFSWCHCSMFELMQHNWIDFLQIGTKSVKSVGQDNVLCYPIQHCAYIFIVYVLLGTSYLE